MTDDLVSRWERLLASDTTTRTFSVRTVAMREALDYIKALTAERDARIDPSVVQYLINAAEANGRDYCALMERYDALQADNARLRDKLADAAVALDAAGMELSDFANCLSREPLEACEAYEAAIDARAAINTGKELSHE